MKARFDVLVNLAMGKGVSVKRVAEDLGFSPSTLYAWKNGVSEPKGDKIHAMAEYFGCQMEDFYK